MSVLENISLLAAPISIILALLFNIIVFVQRQRAVLVGQKPPEEKPIGPTSRFGQAMNTIAIAFVIITLVFVTATIVSRVIEAGHGPFSNMYEFAIAFTWALL